MALFEIKMPKLGESITEGTILSWSVKAGDNVQEDDVLFEVSTAKVSAEIPSPIAGRVEAIFFAEGDTVAVGTVVATILPEGEEDSMTSDSSPTADTEGTQPQPAANTPSPAILSDSAPTAAGADSTRQEPGLPPADPASANRPPSGQAPDAAQRPATEQAAPATGRWYSPVVLQLAREAGLSNGELERIPGTGFEGRLSKKDIQQYIQQKKSGSTGGTATSGSSAPTWAGSADTQGAHASSASASVQISPDGSSAPTSAASSQATGAQTAAPVATDKKSATPPRPSGTASASGAGRPAAQPTGSGAATTSAASASSASSGDTRVEMDRVRRLIADHMVMSKQVSPHVTSVIEIDVTRLVLWRSRLKDEFFRREGIKLTYMPAIAEATARALAEYPQLNASVDGYSVILKKHINLGIAVSLSDGNLIVPVIPDADKLNLSGLAAAIDDLARKARDNKLSAAQIQGGTFTITNFGTFKSLFGTPIINQPEVAILAVGYIEKKPAVVETPEGESIAIRHKMYLSLSYDHRVIDGALGGAFLRRIGDLLENWNA